MKILIYSFNDKLGDGLQKISFLQFLKKIYPNSYISYTTTQTTTLRTILYPLVKGVIDEFIEENNIDSSLLKILKKNPIFLNKHYDLIIDLQKVVTRTLNLKKISHEKFFSTSANFFFSTVKNSLNLKFKDIYIERFYFNILSLLIGERIERINDIRLPYFDTPKLDKRERQKIIGIAPGAGDPIREWGIENYIQIATKLREDGYQVYFFLGPNEQKYLNICESHQFKCPEWDGDTMISQNILFTMNLAKQVDCLLCNDGGTSWLFEFSGVKTFKIFGVTNERKFARPNFCETLQVKDYGYASLQSFPTSLYQELLYKYIRKL